MFLAFGDIPYLFFKVSYSIKIMFILFYPPFQNIISIILPAAEVVLLTFFPVGAIRLIITLPENSCYFLVFFEKFQLELN